MSLTDLTFEVTDEEAEEILASSKTRNVRPPSDGYVTGSQIARYLNDQLEAAGVTHSGKGGKIKPQMVYNYINKGYIKTDEGHYPHVREDEALRWIKVQFVRRTH